MLVSSCSGRQQKAQLHGDGVLQCPICCDTLGLYGGPVTLPCGHNGCKDCLTSVAERSAQCPLCRRPFDKNIELRCNGELRDLISLATKLLNMDEQEHADGWEAFPSAALTSEQYATDLRSHKVSSTSSTGHTPYMALPPSTRGAGAGGGWGAGTGSALLHAPSAPPLLGAAGGEGGFHEVLEMAPLPWLPDSLASACGGCARPFRPITRLRHHCRFCGRIFCHACSSQRALLPPKFCVREPQRVCDMCAASLAPLQQYLAGVMAPAAQAPVHDAHDWLALRAWLNAPYSPSMEGDVYKAANLLNCFTRAGRASPEAGLPTAVLAGARGLVALSCVRVALGAGVATFGTGVVVSRGASGGWSAPCSVALAGLGWGLAVGAQLADVVLVLRSDEAVKAFCGAVHVGVGGNLSVAVGPVGRSADAALLVGSASPATPAAAYAYSCSRGAFLGVSFDSTLLKVRDGANAAFYGLPVTPAQLLVERRVAPPPAAAALYDALRALDLKFESRRHYVHTPQHVPHSTPSPPLALPAPQPPASTTSSNPAPATATQTSQQGEALSASQVLGAQQMPPTNHPIQPSPFAGASSARPAHEVAATMFHGSGAATGHAHSPGPGWGSGSDAWGYAAAPPAPPHPQHGSRGTGGGGWGAASSGTWDEPRLTSHRAGAGGKSDEDADEEAAARYMAALFD